MLVDGLCPRPLYSGRTRAMIFLLQLWIKYQEESNLNKN
jgi:hypothetical protein